MPTEDEVRDIEESANELLGLFDVIEEQQTEMTSLHKANAALWANLCEVHKQRADWYFSFLKEAKGWIGQLLMDTPAEHQPHHAIVFHNKLAKIVEIVEAEKK